MSSIRFEGHRSGSFVTAPRTPLASRLTSARRCSRKSLDPREADPRRRSRFRAVHDADQHIHAAPFHGGNTGSNPVRVAEHATPRKPASAKDLQPVTVGFHQTMATAVLVAFCHFPRSSWPSHRSCRYLGYLFEQLETDRSLSKVPPAMGLYTAILKRDGDWWMARSTKSRAQCASLGESSFFAEEATKEVLGTHVLLTRSLFGGSIRRRLLLRFSPEKSTSARVRFRELRKMSRQAIHSGRITLTLT